MWINVGNGRYTVEYSGGWREGKTHGFGVLYNEYGEKYEGCFEDGKRHGRGRQTYGGRPIDGFGGDVYDGEWAAGMREGYGVLQMGERSKSADFLPESIHLGLDPRSKRGHFIKICSSFFPFLGVSVIDLTFGITPDPAKAD